MTHNSPNYQRPGPGPGLAFALVPVSGKCLHNPG